MQVEKEEIVLDSGYHIYLGGFSEIGIDKKLNQDAIKIGSISGKEIAYILVADGLGSCKKSDEGSAKVIELAEEWINNKLSMYSALSNSVANIFMKKLVEAWNVEYEMDEKYDYDTTVHFSVFYKGNVLVGGIGDGMVLISYDDLVCKDFVDAADLFSNVTNSMCSVNVAELMDGEVVENYEYSRGMQVIISTDGISDDLIPEKKLTLPEYFRSVIKENGHENLQIEIEEWIQDWKTDGHSDDKSICYMIIEKEV